MSLRLIQILSAGGVRRVAAIDDDGDARLIDGVSSTYGSAESRDEMHQAAAAGTTTDSMRMFLLGLEGGKPAAGQVGVQPEWFYKGDGSSVVAPGFCLANEFSDHVTERGNYLWLAHSKLRPAALGAELLTGELPRDVRGVCRITRDGRTLWEKPFLTGEANMSHTLANLEHHHFKYPLFRRAGDVHVHFFGTVTLSFAEGMQARVGDVFEIEARPFRLPLRNPLGRAASAAAPALPL